jgi:hypothetical protein
MQGKINLSLEIYLICSFSEFVSQKILHDLYQLCCEKRFTANPVEKLQPLPRTTLYKYLVIPKEGQPPQPPPQIQQPKTPTVETRPSTNPFAHPSTYLSPEHQPPEIKRRTSHNSSQMEHEQRPRSGTQPFIEHPEQLQHLSTMRSGNGGTRRAQYHPKFDEQQEEEEEQ